MNWVPVTLDDLADAKLDPELAATRTAALASGQTDPAPRVIVDVVIRIRTAVASCTRNRLDSDTTKVPRSLHALAARMVTRELKKRLGSALPLTDDEREDQRNDERLLREVAACSLLVETPDAPITAAVEAASGAQIASGGRKNFSRDSLRGF